MAAAYLVMHVPSGDMMSFLNQVRSAASVNTPSHPTQINYRTYAHVLTPKRLSLLHFAELASLTGHQVRSSWENSRLTKHLTNHNNGSDTTMQQTNYKNCCMPLYLISTPSPLVTRMVSCALASNALSSLPFRTGITEEISLLVEPMAAIDRQVCCCNRSLSDS